MKIKTADFPDNSYVESIMVQEDGTVAILYRGCFNAFMRTNGQDSEFIKLGPSLQVRLIPS